MSKIYKRKCNNCGKYYEGYGKYFCSYSCANKISGFQKGNKLQIGNKNFLNHTHTKECKEKMGKFWKGKRIGKDNPNFRNGKYQGVYTYYPNHPFASKRGYIKTSHLVAEKYLGRYLIPEEVIHHINEILSDNHSENLYLFPSQSAHFTFHNLKNKPIIKSNPPNIKVV